MVEKSSVSSRSAERIAQSEEISPDVLGQEIAESMARLAAMTDDDIDYSDIPPTDFSTPGEYYRGLDAWRARKEQVTVRIDGDVLAWFRDHHEKYQAAINQALREHIERNRNAS